MRPASLVLAAALTVPLTGWGCGSRIDRNLGLRTIASPDRSHALRIQVETSQSDPRKYLCVKFEIVDAQGRVEYAVQTGASDVMRWSLDWDGNDRVVLNSSDIGRRTWLRGDDGRWVEASTAAADRATKTVGD